MDSCERSWVFSVTKNPVGRKRLKVSGSPSVLSYGLSGWMKLGGAALKHDWYGQRVSRLCLAGGIFPFPV